MQSYLDASAGRIVHHSMIYVMPNDRQKLLQSFRHDFPDGARGPEISVAAGKSGQLRIAPGSTNASGLDLSLDIVGVDRPDKKGQSAVWKASPWGGFVRGDATSRMWAYPTGEQVDVCVSLA